MSMDGVRYLAAMLCALSLLGVGRARADEPRLTLEQALAEARRANAVLPVVRLDADGADAAIREARGRRYPALAFDGDLHMGTPSHYASGDARAQLVAEVPVFDGGRLRAGVDRSLAAANAAHAGVHQAERDLDRDVRARFAECLEAEAEVAFREAGLARLDTYLSIIGARHASGQGLASDRAKTLVRLGEGRAAIADAERRVFEAKLELNDLLGRVPDAPLALEPPSTPIAAPLAPALEPWGEAPELAAAAASVAEAGAARDEVHADRWPTVSLLANAGAQPLVGHSDEALLNNGQGWGAEFVLLFHLPLWDAGVYRSRVAQADLAEKAAKQRVVATQRGVRLAWQRAAAQLGALLREVAIRAGTIDSARDAYLQSESLYRGGVGTALDVLESYDAWTSASQAHAEAELRYRLAEADLLRWQNP
jgi:outer membrane protein